MLTYYLNFIIYHHLICPDDCMCMSIRVYGHTCVEMSVLFLLLHGLGRDFLTKALGGKDPIGNESSKVTVPGSNSLLLLGFQRH